MQEAETHSGSQQARQMRYRIIAQITDEEGSTTDVELMPETNSEPAWRCSHAIWPAWVKDAQTMECGWCRQPLEPCEIVECPWCEVYVTTDDVLRHWDRGCYEGEENEPQATPPVAEDEPVEESG
jgi:hypothetical protein